MRAGGTGPRRGRGAVPARSPVLWSGSLLVVLLAGPGCADRRGTPVLRVRPWSVRARGQRRVLHTDPQATLLWPVLRAGHVFDVKTLECKKPPRPRPLLCLKREKMPWLVCNRDQQSRLQFVIGLRGQRGPRVVCRRNCAALSTLPRARSTPRAPAAPVHMLFGVMPTEHAQAERR